MYLLSLFDIGCRILWACRYMSPCMLFNINEKTILFTLRTKLIISLLTFCYNSMIFDENCKVQRVYCIANAIKSEWIFILPDITYLFIYFTVLSQGAFINFQVYLCIVYSHSEYSHILCIYLVLE